MLGLDDDADSARLQMLDQPVGDLLGEPLLDLRTAREVLGEAGQLGQAKNALGGQVADVDGAKERQQMVLADRPLGLAGSHPRRARQPPGQLR